MGQQARLRSNNWYLFLFILLASCGTSEPDFWLLDVDDKNLEKKKGVYYFQGEPLNGKIHEYYSSGMFLAIMEYQNGIRNGITEKFWPDGSTKFEASYKNGVYDGEVKEWYKDGSRYSVFNYEDGHESGKQRIWNADGSFKANYVVVGDRKFGLTGVKNCSNVWED